MSARFRCWMEQLRPFQSQAVLRSSTWARIWVLVQPLCIVDWSGTQIIHQNENTSECWSTDAEIWGNDPWCKKNASTVISASTLDSHFTRMEWTSVLVIIRQRPLCRMRQPTQQTVDSGRSMPRTVHAKWQTDCCWSHYWVLVVFDDFGMTTTMQL